MNYENIDCGRGILRNVDGSRLTTEQLVYFMRLGLQNSLQDSYSSIKKDDPDVLTLSASAVDKRLASIYEGKTHSSGRRGDEVQTEAREIARKYYNKAIISNGRKLKDVKTEERKAFIDANWKKFEAKARQNIAELEDIQLDADELVTTKLFDEMRHEEDVA
jgi:hypothetical protein